jgi:hypothetical protein
MSVLGKKSGLTKARVRDHPEHRSQYQHQIFRVWCCKTKRNGKELEGIVPGQLQPGALLQLPPRFEATVQQRRETQKKQSNILTATRRRSCGDVAVLLGGIGVDCLCFEENGLESFAQKKVLLIVEALTAHDSFCFLQSSQFQGLISKWTY